MQPATKPPADDPKSRLHACIAGLTRSGQLSLDESAMRELKQLCRRDDQLLDLCHALLCHRLAEAHAQIRYSAFQIVDQLFRRSARFRVLTLDRFERLVDSVLIANEADTPPPKPVPVFRQLGDLALEAFIDWHEQFSQAHPKLVFAFRYLSEAHSVRLRQVRDRLAQTAATRSAEARRLAGKKRDLLADIGRQMGEEEPELQACLATVANSLDLLVPSPTEFDVNPLTSASIRDVEVQDQSGTEEEEATASTEDEQRRLHGIVGSATAGGAAVVVALRLCRPSLRETPDNAELIEALVTRSDQLRRRMRPRLARWLAVAERCTDADDASASADVDDGVRLRRRLAELLMEADRLLARVQSLRIVRGDAAAALAGGDASDDDDNSTTADDCDFEVVVKEGFETEAVAASTIAALTSTYTRNSTTVPKSTSTSSGPSTSADAAAAASSSSSVPVVPFGIDLINWGASGSATIGYRPDDGGHAFGYRPPDGDAAFEIQGSRDQLTMRTILFATADEPVRRACRHPLPADSGGGLCQRMDRVKCPFHGRIVARDEAGRPTAVEAVPPVEESPPASARKKKTTKKRKAEPDPTPAPAGSGGGGAVAGLVDIRSLEDTPRTRLAARVASKAALRRAGEDEAARVRRKHEQKFGDHFQYQFLN